MTWPKNWHISSNISGSTAPIFAFFTPYESTLGADDGPVAYFHLSRDVAMATDEKCLNCGSLGVRGHPRSSETLPFDRVHMTSYSTLIETVRLSCTVFELYRTQCNKRNARSSKTLRKILRHARKRMGLYSRGDKKLNK